MATCFCVCSKANLLPLHGNLEIPIVYGLLGGFRGNRWWLLLSVTLAEWGVWRGGEGMEVDRPTY